LPSFGGISRYLQIKLKTFFLFYLLNSGKTDLAYLTEHKQTVLDSLKITPKQLVFHRLSSQEKRKSRRKARNLAKLYCDVKYRKIRTVDDVYKHFL
jgi:radical SAM superfamily enzyme